MKVFFSKFIVLLILIFGFTEISNAQTIIQVAGGGVDSISAALANAPAGSIIELTTSGGEYIESLTDSIKVNITLRAAAGLTQKPVIYSGSGETAFLVTHGSFIVQGVEFNGIAHGTPFGLDFIDVNADLNVPSPFVLKIDNCEFDNCQSKSIFISGNTETPLDSVFVTNTVFRDNNKEDMYFQQTRHSSNIFPGGYKYGLVQNCLGVGVKNDGDGYFSYIEPGNRDSSGHPSPTLIVNHCTVDSAYDGLSTYTTAGAVVENCIVTNLKDTTLYAFAVESSRYTGALATTVENCITFNEPHAIREGNAYSTTIIKNCIDADPMYNNPANMDYTLKSGSPGKNAGTDGLDIGYIPGGINTGIKQIKDQTPTSFQLSQNYPNPFNPTTIIEFSIPNSGNYSIKVYNMLGQEVANLLNNEEVPGIYRVNFNASGLSSGVYFYILSGNNINLVKKMMLLK